MPPYRLPFKLFDTGSWDKAFYFTIWHRLTGFLKKAGKIILLTSILLWFLTSYPKASEGNPQASSYAYHLGKLIEPVIKPIGFDWQIGVGLIASLAAREVIVSSLSTIYNVENQGELALTKALLSQISPPQAFSLLIFFVFALQCFSTLAVAKRETGSWIFPLLMFSYMLLLAYGAAFVVYRITLPLF